MVCSVFRRSGFLLAALALFSIAGGHWAVLQTVAWVEMLRDYTQKTGSMAVAVEQTFDGQHPCELCLQIATAKQQENTKVQGGRQKSDGSKPGIVKADKSEKAIPFQKGFSPVWMAATGLRWNARSTSIGSSREEQPPTPPPRLSSCA